MSSVLTVGECRNGELRGIVPELVTAAEKFTPGTNGDIHSAIIADGEIDHSLVRFEGASESHLINYEGGYNNHAHIEIIDQLVSAHDIDIVVLPHTVTGMDYAPAVAGRLDRPLITNAIDIIPDESPLIQRKLYGGKVDSTVKVTRDDFVLTLREGQLPPAPRKTDGEVSRFEPDLPGGFGTEVVEVREIDLTDEVDITESEFIVSIGLGIGGEEENMELVKELANVANATLACSRPIVERGWLPRSRQVGQSGETVTPRVYIAIGISGAVEHRVGMKTSDTIIAINTDPDAPIFDIADYGIVDDLKDVVPELIDQLKS